MTSHGLIGGAKWISQPFTGCPQDGALPRAPAGRLPPQRLRGRLRQIRRVATRTAAAWGGRQSPDPPLGPMNNLIFGLFFRTFANAEGYTCRNLCKRSGTWHVFVAWRFCSRCIALLLVFLLLPAVPFRFSGFCVSGGFHLSHFKLSL